MNNKELKVLQASVDQLQKQLNAVYNAITTLSIDDEKSRRELKEQNSQRWTDAYQKAKDSAARD